jgi:hypothetical protein
MRKLSLHTFYRLSVWLPLLVPVILTVLMNLTTWRPHGSLGGVLGLIAYSGFVGGIFYLPLAAWAMFWIGVRPEREIRRRALLTPLLMILAFSLWPAVIVLLGEVKQAIGVLLFGAAVILVLGYAYVLIVFGTRALLFGRMDRHVVSA